MKGHQSFLSLLTHDRVVMPQQPTVSSRALALLSYQQHLRGAPPGDSKCLTHQGRWERARSFPQKGL